MKKARCPVKIAFTTKATVAPIYCGQWSCTRCRSKLARKWAAVAVLGIKTLPGKSRFWTLTMLPRYKSTTEAYKMLPKLWDALRKDMQRLYKRWDYLAFVEGQPERGDMPHFHIISMQPIPEKYPRIKEFAVHHGFGYQADDKPVTHRKAAAYVAKYASKGTPGIPKHFQRVRPSKQWPKLPDSDEFDAYIVQQLSELYIDYIERVSNLTGIDHDTLNDRYNAALKTFIIESIDKPLTN